ncbi:MAG TPA: non-homologous end-joining DNA ligase [Longimicrobiaceae bacterium]|nr:non-homologous end-joining DNA ligase [Longimicrobiaceae bacterium]
MDDFSIRSYSRSIMARGDEAEEIAGVKVTHPDRVLYPEQGITKRELAEYYVAVEALLLPHLRGRPLTLVRCPSGQETQCFYQRRAAKGTPQALGRVRVPVEGEEETYLVANTLRAVVSLVQMGVLEMHVWGARRDRLDRPDRMILDLDPAPGIAWAEVVEAAVRIRDLLAGVGLEGFVKTSGGKGLHVVAPLLRGHGWEEVREFSRAVAETMARRDPDRFLTSASREEREGKIYVDYLRNSWSASAVAAYSTRARPGAPVSFPLDWDELGADTRPGDFTVRTVPELARRRRDPWARMGEVRQTIRRGMLERLEGD